MNEDIADLSQLNSSEREILRLFAMGHTAKSVSALTARSVGSVGSVNERLREARRKTGVGSSRELSRLLMEQENRDDKIGVEAGPKDDPTSDGAGTNARPALLQGAIIMSLIFCLLTAGLFMANSGEAPAADGRQLTRDDPVLAGGFPPDTPQEQYRRLRAEKRVPPGPTRRKRD